MVFRKPPAHPAGHKLENRSTLTEFFSPIAPEDRIASRNPSNPPTNLLSNKHQKKIPITMPVKGISIDLLYSAKISNRAYSAAGASSSATSASATGASARASSTAGAGSGAFSATTFTGTFTSTSLWK